MGAIGIWQWLIIAVIALLVFGGRGKISSIMGDLGKGITSFRKGLKEGPDEDEDDDEKGKDAIDITPPKDKTKSKTK